MLYLEDLRFKNVGRFVEEQSVDFTSLSNFIQVDGKNNNTGGSSGSGKTTLFMALDYLLGVNHRPATILQSRYTEEPLFVQGKFSKDDKIYTITRSKGSIKVHEYDKELKGTQAEELIDNLLGMPRDLFRKIMHKRQREGGFFLAFTPQQMNDFLIDCIGLSKIKKEYKVLEERLTYLEQVIGAYDADIKQNRAVLKATQDAILSLGFAPIQDMHKAVVDELKAKYEQSAFRLADVQKKCESIYREQSLKRPDITNRQYDGTVREALEKRREEIEAAINACFDKERSRQEKIKDAISRKHLERGGIVSRIDKGRRTKNDAAKIASEIKSIRAKYCPTCSQIWANEGSAQAEQRKLEELASFKDAITDGNLAEGDLGVVDLQLDDLQARLKPVYDPALPTLNEELAEVVGDILEEKRKAGELYEQQNSETKRALDEFTNKMHELQAKHQLAIEQVRGQVELDLRVYDIAVQKLKSYEEAKFRYDKTFNELKVKENELIERLTGQEGQIVIFDHEQKLASESLRAKKTYVSYSFDQALDEISDKATKIIRCIPNMSNATIQFEGTKENKDGKVKEEVNAILSMDGEPTVPVKSLSGGELSATDLAIDLAVIDYIETRSGMGINIFILDEPFNGLGTVEIEMALSVLKNSNTKKKLIIVDHNPEVKQMVQSRLVIERTGLTSKVQ
jgi:energy-coupling factor transporter ATP-binding protein EcfA2